MIYPNLTRSIQELDKLSVALEIALSKLNEYSDNKDVYEVLKRIQEL